MDKLQSLYFSDRNAYMVLEKVLEIIQNKYQISLSKKDAKLLDDFKTVFKKVFSQYATNILSSTKEISKSLLELNGLSLKTMVNEISNKVASSREQKPLKAMQQQTPQFLLESPEDFSTNLDDLDDNKSINMEHIGYTEHENHEKKYENQGHVVQQNETKQGDQLKTEPITEKMPEQEIITKKSTLAFDSRMNKDGKIDIELNGVKSVLVKSVVFKNNDYNITETKNFFSIREILSSSEDKELSSEWRLITIPPGYYTSKGIVSKIQKLLGEGYQLQVDEITGLVNWSNTKKMEQQKPNSLTTQIIQKQIHFEVDFTDSNIGTILGFEEKFLKANSLVHVSTIPCTINQDHFINFSVHELDVNEVILLDTPKGITKFHTGTNVQYFESPRDISSITPVLEYWNKEIYKLRGSNLSFILEIEQTKLKSISG